MATAGRCGNGKSPHQDRVPCVGGRRECVGLCPPHTPAIDTGGHAIGGKLQLACLAAKPEGENSFVLGDALEQRLLTGALAIGRVQFVTHAEV